MNNDTADHKDSSSGFIPLPIIRSHPHRQERPEISAAWLKDGSLNVVLSRSFNEQTGGAFQAGRKFLLEVNLKELVLRLIPVFGPKAGSARKLSARDGFDGASQFRIGQSSAPPELPRWKGRRALKWGRTMMADDLLIYLPSE